MDRKKALKEMKKQKKDYNNEEEKNIVSRFIMTIGLILIALVLLYLFVGFFITKTIGSSNDIEESNNVSLDSSTILASKIFDQSEEEYYVLIYNPEEKIYKLNKYIEMFVGKEEKPVLYKVDSTNKFNSNYIVTEDSNRNPSNYEELRIISPTLMKINSKSVVEYYEGFEEVKNVFKK